jgi:mannose-6-phosphate isomerase class I
MQNSPYRPHPVVPILSVDEKILSGFETIGEKIGALLDQHPIIAIECYPSTDKAILIQHWSSLFDQVIDTDEAWLKDQELDAFLHSDLTDDRVFGHMTHKILDDLRHPQRHDQLKEKIHGLKGKTLLIGLGSSLFHPEAKIILTSVSRWEIQLRFRRGEAANFNTNNFKEDPLRMFKRGYFVDWRIADRHKIKLWPKVDFVLDVEDAHTPKLLSKKAVDQALSEAAHKPISMVPYFDPGLWGGNWMKERFNLPQDRPNYAWSFNGVPEENALCLSFGQDTFTLQGLDLVLFESKNLMGHRNVARFGREFPIRFDFLDTMNGGNLSLQVHPVTDYIQRTFGMHYTQDESYYILDAGKNASVYLGVKTGTNLNDLTEDLKQASLNVKTFDDERFINRIPAKKHDHFLIPAGTIHCSGSDSVVLEISATPYIFTFKLWDWGRVGMDGRPRPIHLDHAKEVIQIERDTQWVHDHLVNHLKPGKEEPGLKEESTGLHELEFIETTRHWFEKPFTIETGNTVHMLMLVEGQSVLIKDPEHHFEDTLFHYAECFIVPASVKRFIVEPVGKEKHALISAYVRSTKEN